MSNFNLSIEGHFPYTGVIELDTLPSKVLYRIPHDIERDSNGKYVHGKRDGKPREIEHPEGTTNIYPELYRANQDQTVPIKNYSALINLHYQFNPEYTKERADLLLGEGLGWCNAQWGVYHAPMIAAGTILEKVKVENNKVYFKSILINEPAPTLQHAIDNHLYQVGTSINVQSGDIAEMMRANGHGTRSRVHILIARKFIEDLWFYQDELHKLPLGFVPPNAIWLP